MIHKTSLVITLLIVLATASVGALQVQFLVGLSDLLLTTFEFTVLTPPDWLGGYQQEIGLRLCFPCPAYINLDLVLRSWLWFPDASSDFIRQRLRCGIEYSPTLFEASASPDVFPLNFEGWLPKKFETGLCGSIRVDDPATATTTDFLLSALLCWGWVEGKLKIDSLPLEIIIGLAFRSKDL